jgi:hypothetical protein
VTAPPAAQVQRPARALIGWLPVDQAAYFLNGQRTDQPTTPELLDRIRRAHAAVASRAIGATSGEVICEAPATLDNHIVALHAADATQGYWNEGWRVALADLRLVCALQPHVYSDHAAERTDGVNADDLVSIARVSLPLTTQGSVPAQYDPQRQSWILSSPNPNLHIIANWGGQVQAGRMGYGFAVGIVPSFIQVARVRDRFVLRDGYHRALGFLQRGIPVVPVLVREYASGEDLGLGQGWLPQSVYLGDRPPKLTDYSDDAVSADVSLPAFQRMIVIPGLELTRLG